MQKDSVTRFSISMSGDLVAQLDAMRVEQGYANRSQAIADMVRDRLVEHRSQSRSGEIAGTVTLIYDHHRPNLQAQLTEGQHEHQELIVATLHIHLDHHNCMEVIAVRGRAEAVRHLADTLITTKGVKHGKLTVTTTGKEFG